jgi:hypothetical protein
VNSELLVGMLLKTSAFTIGYSWLQDMIHAAAASAGRWRIRQGVILCYRTDDRGMITLRAKSLATI